MARATLDLEYVLSALQGIRRNHAGYVALCPAHDDKSPSLSIGKGRNGRVLLYCHAGCSYEEVRRAIG